MDEFKLRVTDRINEVMRLTFLQTKSALDCKFGCFEVFGYDFMLDDDCNPQLLEININPALFLDTTVQAEIIPKLVKDMVNISLGVHQPHSKSSTQEKIQEVFNQHQSLKYSVLHTE